MSRINDEPLRNSLLRIEAASTVGEVLAEVAMVNVWLAALHETEADVHSHVARGDEEITNDLVEKLKEWIDETLERLRKLPGAAGATITITVGWPHITVAVAFAPVPAVGGGGTYL
jgi:hypothetical protein